MCTISPTNIQHPPSLEVVSIIVHPGANLQMLIVAAYRRLQLPIRTFVTLLSGYMDNLPYPTMLTIILGDINVNLRSSSVLMQFMSSLGFVQHVDTPTIDSGSLLDHIYSNQSCPRCVVDVVDTYYSDHDSCFVSILKNN